MKLGIDGKAYDLKGALSSPSLNDLHALLLSTGVGVKTLKLRMQRVDDLPDFEDLFEDAELMVALKAVIWLARRKAGERLTIDEANDFGMDTFELIREEGDEAKQEDPTTAPTDSVPDVGALGELPDTTTSPETSTTSEPLS